MMSREMARAVRAKESLGISALPIMGPGGQAAFFARPKQHKAKPEIQRPKASRRPGMENGQKKRRHLKQPQSQGQRAKAETLQNTKGGNGALFGDKRLFVLFAATKRTNAIYVALRIPGTRGVPPAAEAAGTCGAAPHEKSIPNFELVKIRDDSCLYTLIKLQFKPGRSGQDSSPCSMRPQSPLRTFLEHLHMHRPQR